MLQRTAAVAILLAARLAAGAPLTPPAPYDLVRPGLLGRVHVPPTLVCVGPVADGAATGPAREACRWLGHAERELDRGQLPEAAAFAVRAERAASGAADSAALEASARLVRAEALARSGRAGEAETLADSLARTARGRTRTAAGLLAARLLLDAGRASAAVSVYARVLSEDAAYEADRRAGLLPAAEAALAAGDGAAARRWLREALGPDLESADLGSADSAAVRIRLADAMVSAGERREALALLRTVEAEAGSAPVGVLAAARAAHLASRETPGHAVVEALSGLAATSDRSVSRSARETIAWSLLERGAFLEALGALGPLTAEAGTRLQEWWLRSALEEAFAALPALAATNEGCRSIVAAVGAELPDLARRAGAAGALDAVAACSRRLGLESYAARLRAERDGLSGGARQRAADGRAQPPLAEGPVAAEAAFARGDFMAAKAMAGAGPWASLAAAAETAERARAAAGLVSPLTP